MVLGSDSPVGRCYLYLVSLYLLFSWLPHVWSNTILYHCLATQSARFLFLSLYWLYSAHSYYLYLDDRYWLFGISSSLIDFYLITFGTHMDISSTFLSLLLTRSWHLFGTYSHFVFNILLRGFVYYKNPIYNSRIDQLLHPTVQSSFALIFTIEIIFVNSQKLVTLIIQLYSHSYSFPQLYLLSSLVYCQSPMWLLKHVVVSYSTIFLITKWVLKTTNQKFSWYLA